MHQILHDIVNFVFPARCHICDGSLAGHERFVCTGCLRRIPRSGYHRRSLNPMEERFAGIIPFERGTGHFLYDRDSPLSMLIQDMKYRGFPDIGNMLGELAAAELYTTGFFNDIDVIVPVPMHFLKQMKRGYNQTHHIAKGVSAAVGIPVIHALKAVRSHKTQTALTREERLKNTSGMFRVKEISDIEGRHVLLVDDVCTTGSTLISAGEAVAAANPSAITLFTLAVTY